MSNPEQPAIDINQIISKYYNYVDMFDETQLPKYLVNIAGNLAADFNIISIVGGAGSGKSYLVQKIRDILPESDTICTDDFLIGTRNYRKKHMSEMDPLEKYDFELLRNKVLEIRLHCRERSVWVPIYNEFYGSGVSVGNEAEIDESEIYSGRFVSNVKYLLIEGDFQPLLTIPDLLIFLHLPDNIRLNNRLKRDLNARNYQDEDGIIKNFYQRNLSQHIPYTMPWASRANILINTLVDPSGKYMYCLYKNTVSTHGIANKR